VAGRSHQLEFDDAPIPVLIVSTWDIQQGASSIESQAGAAKP
jgi:hypothetical protein